MRSLILGITALALSVAFAGPATADTLYLLEGSQQGFSSFDTDTGVETVIGNTGVNRLQGMDTNPLNGVLFAIETVGSNGLYTIDANTGLASLVGNTNIGDSPESLAFAADGTLYAATSGSPDLYTIDTNNGNATLLGSISGMTDVDGLSVLQTDVNVFGQGLVSAGTLLAVDGQQLYLVDPNTYVATVVGGIDANETIATDSFGRLYGVDGQERVYEIDMGTLDSTLLGNSSFGTVWGSAVAREPIPEPGTLALLGLGLAGTLVVRRRRRA